MKLAKRVTRDAVAGDVSGKCAATLIILLLLTLLLPRSVRCKFRAPTTAGHVLLRRVRSRFESPYVKEQSNQPLNAPYHSECDRVRQTLIWPLQTLIGLRHTLTACPARRCPTAKAS